jgi:molybdopterin-containing oxidoreductase family membrane subunit
MWIIHLIALMLALIWGVMFLRQMRKGLTSTDLGDKFTWGLYVQGFFYFSALAGGILVFIAVVTLFEINSLMPLAGVASAVSLGCLAAAGMLLGSDLGKPLRGLKIITGKNFASPLTWDFITLSLCGILNLIFLTGLVSGPGPVSIIWAVLCLFAALGFVMIHTLFFLSRVGAGFRSQPFLGLDTLAQSLLGGTALITLIALLLGVKPSNMIRLLLILTILVLIPLGASYIASLSTKNKGEEFKKIMGMEFILLLILFLIQMVGPDNPVLLAIGSILILVSVFLEKSHLMRQYQKKPILPLPYSSYDGVPAYSPTTFEWVMSLGSVGACVLISLIVFDLRTILLG